jgi:hypothetical protein
MELPESIVTKALDDVYENIIKVVAEFDTCCETAIKDLETITYDELKKRPDETYRAPDVEEISGNRWVIQPK